MKDVGSGLENYLNTEKHMTSCDLFELRLADGGLHFYTDADKDILYEGHNYRHDVLLINRQQVKLHDSVVVDTMSVNIYAEQIIFAQVLFPRRGCGWCNWFVWRPRRS